ncbi:ABC transporter permease [Herbiconiux sp. A18JL235]|uniref:ABC transporter permease n=1 Tax=Herbiconiux sp. A18JL235 TaxID=3152363 RepID=A0AB39BBE9_9MICO
MAAEAVEGVGGRRSRLLIGAIGTAVGVATLVMALGLGQTAAGRIADRFHAASATQVEVRPTEQKGSDGDSHATAVLPDDAIDRALRLSGVRAAALLATVDPVRAPVRAAAVVDPEAPAHASPPVLALAGDAVTAFEGRVDHGRFLESGHEARADRVAVLGASAAAALGIPGAETAPSIDIAGHSYTVLGILTEAAGDSTLLGAVMVPRSTALHDFGGRPALSGERMRLAIAPGAAEQVSMQVPVALDPNGPDRFTAGAQEPPPVFQEAVSGDLDSVFLLIAAITLLAASVGIAGVSMLSVSERRGEIGLRRALGATARHIALQFVLESALVGGIGGAAGAALGVGGVVAVSATQGWVPVLDVATALLGALVGGVLGLVAGSWPALTATRVEPAAALRDG